MLELEKKVFQCQYDFLSYLVLPLLRLSTDSFGEGYFKTYLTFSGKIVVAASAVNDTLNYTKHKNYLLSFRESDKLYIVFNHPKKYENTIISIINGEYSNISSEALGLIRNYSGMVFKLPTTTKGKFYTHPILAGILKLECIKEKLEKLNLDYNGEFLPPLSMYEDLIDLDTII